MDTAVVTADCRLGAKQRHSGQFEHQSAGQQHHEQLQLEQPVELNDVQRASPRKHATSKRHCSSLHGWRNGQLLDRHIRFGELKRDWDWRGNLSQGRAVRIAQAGKDDERVWLEGGGSSHPLPRHTSFSRHGHGGNSVSIPWSNWKTSHTAVAAKPRMEA